MKNSTVLVVGTLALAGAGAYLYLKGKKTPIVADNSLGLSPTTDDTKLLTDLGVKVEEPKATPYVAPVEGVPLLTAENLQKALLALGIDQTRSITELASPNYIEAKKLASDIQNYSSASYKKSYDYWYTVLRFNKQNTNNPTKPIIAPNVAINEATKKLNALGYKLLPNFDIEKM